jgi:hypothetical protein
MPKMTILEVLKKIKHVDRKIETAKIRLAKWCSYFDFEADTDTGLPLYDTEKLLQSLKDMISVRATYRHALHKANIKNTVEYNGREHTLDELIMMRTVSLPAVLECLKLLRRKEKNYTDLRHMTEDERKAVRIITQFDALKRDKSIDKVENEMAEIDRVLDDINIVTETDIDR